MPKSVGFLLMSSVLIVSLGAASQASGAAANVSVAFPPDLASQVTTVGPTLGAAWNYPGNRCEQDCGAGGGAPANVGVAAFGFAFVAHGSTPPQLEVYSDGRVVGRTPATQSGTLLINGDGNYDIYTIGLQTRCSTRKLCQTGTNAGQNCNTAADCPGTFFPVCAPKFCNNANECNDATHTNEACILCDATSCSDTNAALCPTTCTGGLNSVDEGKECTSSANCGGGGTCSATCLMLKNCGRSTTNSCSNVPVKDCTATGAPVFQNETAYSGSNINTANKVVGAKPLHVAYAQVIGNLWDYSANAIGQRQVIGSAQNVFRMVVGNSANFSSTCSTNCAGTVVGLSGTSAPSCQ
jgi:hypothetical protein